MNSPPTIMNCVPEATQTPPHDSKTLGSAIPLPPEAPSPPLEVSDGVFGKTGGSIPDPRPNSPGSTGSVSGF
jgi:hypothetical protein